jgi:hypothetical protein
MLKSAFCIDIHLILCIINTEVIYMVRRLNITIPEDVAKRLDNVRNKSKFISDAVREKLEKLEKEKLEKLLAEGYKAVKEEDKKINDEWEKITLEGWK